MDREGKRVALGRRKMKSGEGWENFFEDNFAGKMFLNVMVLQEKDGEKEKLYD